jgi:peptidoglycan hydrolase-like protein with peptidoglycan-binding domain
MQRSSVSFLPGGGALGLAVTLANPSPAYAAPSPSAAVASIAQTSVLQPWPVLRQGARGEPVRSLQYLLKAHGASVVDGIFGPRTQAAVVAFQRSHSLVANGVVGQSTWLKVIVTVRRGSAGSAVKAVQDQLNFRNLSGLPATLLAVDGIFGPKTDAKMRAFQAAVATEMPFLVDGVVCPQTWHPHHRSPVLLNRAAPC